MENLAGRQDADSFVIEELALAGVPSRRCRPRCREVPYSVEGVLGDWTLTRAWTYWVAQAREGNGLPLDVALQLHARAYEGRGYGAYGQVIRVDGDCTAPSPQDRCKRYDADGRQIIVDPSREQEDSFKRFVNRGIIGVSELEKLRFVRDLEGIAARSVIDLYHIDTQLGLNEFSRVLKTL